MKDISKDVKNIIKRVRNEGDAALSFYTKKYDGISLKPSMFKVPKARITASGRELEYPLQKALKTASENIKHFHETELLNLPLSWTQSNNNILTGHVYRPIENAGIYVPGGRFSYPSTVLMTAIPAKIAGVKRIVVVTPPKNMTSAVLYACFLCGIDEVYSVGGPAAVAALAYGTQTIPKVDIIAGPGNSFVNEAKRQVLGICGIDSLAGPSEVAIIADKNANPEYIALDMLAQAEHDPQAKAYLFSDSSELIETVKKLMPEAYNRQMKFQACSIEAGIENTNKLAPEHLEIMVRHPEKVVKKIYNAGAIFVGSNTPTAIGDYWAGPSHVLPTGGTARFSGGLSCATFIKKISYINYTGKKLVVKDSLEAIANTEGLNYHALSAKIRS